MKFRRISFSDLHGKMVAGTILCCSGIANPNAPAISRALERTRGSRSLSEDLRIPRIFSSLRGLKKKELPPEFVGERHGDSCGHRRRMTGYGGGKD